MRYAQRDFNEYTAEDEAIREVWGVDPETEGDYGMLDVEPDATGAASMAMSPTHATRARQDVEPYDFVPPHDGLHQRERVDVPAARDMLVRLVERVTRSQRDVAIAQAAYFVAAGVWPLLDMRSFQWITGRTTDRWLVKTVGALVAVTGATIGAAALRRRITPETRLLAIGSAAALAAIELAYVARRRISPVYLLDAIAQAALIAAWRRAPPHEEAPGATPPSVAADVG